MCVCVCLENKKWNLTLLEKKKKNKLAVVCINWKNIESECDLGRRECDPNKLFIRHILIDWQSLSQVLSETETLVGFFCI